MSTYNTNNEDAKAGKLDHASRESVREALADHHNAGDDRTIGDVFTYLGDLFSRLSSDLGSLFSLHMDLLKAELSESAGKLAKDSAMLAVAGVLGLFAFMGITLGLIALVASFFSMNAFLSAAAGAGIVGVLYAIIAGVLASVGISHLKKRSLTPERSIQEAKRDKELVKDLT